jgi:ribonuclease/clavin/mitogillin
MMEGNAQPPAPWQAPWPAAPWIGRHPVRTPTLPPATHTNAYVVGNSRTGLAVIDPASPYTDEQAALDRLLAALPAEVAAIVLSHHHVDHVSGAAHLAGRLGVPVLAHPVTAELLAGRLQVDRLLVEGQRLPFGEHGLLALHTPGHAAGHLCFVDEQAGVLLAGDMVASVGTIIVDPAPGEGDMRLYLEQLARLRALEAQVILPSHGEPIADPRAHLSHYIEHRLARERLVLAALAQGAATVEQLVPRAYPDIAPTIYPLAARSLLSHLIKLRDEGRAGEHDGTWALA